MNHNKQQFFMKPYHNVLFLKKTCFVYMKASMYTCRMFTQCSVDQSAEL